MIGFTLCAALSIAVVDQSQSSNGDNEKIYLSKQNTKANYGVIYVETNDKDVSGNVICKLEDWQRYSDAKNGNYLTAPKSAQVVRDGSVSAYVYTWAKNGPQFLQTTSSNDGIIINDNGDEKNQALLNMDSVLHSNRAVIAFKSDPKSIKKCTGPAGIPK